MDQPNSSSLIADDPRHEEIESVAARLRSISHPAHVRINHHPFLSGLTKPAYPLGKYIALLAAYHHIYAAIEGQIDAFLAHAKLPFDYAERRKLPWLTADLRHFGIDPAIPDFVSLPLTATPHAGAGALIGALYVIEGATLGGQVIARSLRVTLGVAAGSGASFFNGYGDAVETQRRWHEFGVFANSIERNPQQRRLAELSALGVFDLIEKQLHAYHARYTH